VLDLRLPKKRLDIPMMSPRVRVSVLGPVPGPVPSTGVQTLYKYKYRYNVLCFSLVHLITSIGYNLYTSMDYMDKCRRSSDSCTKWKSEYIFQYK
jgi:hypothetical protein